MAVVSSFPLLNLPFVPFNEVINYMVPVEQFCFLLISKKSMEPARRKKVIDLEIKELDCSTTEIICKDQNGSMFLNISIAHISRECQCRDLNSQKFDDVAVFLKVNNSSMLTLWESEIEGIQEILPLLFNIFEIRKFSLNSELMHKEDVFKIITQFQELKLQTKANVSKIEISVPLLDNYMYRYIMENCNDVPEINVLENFKKVPGLIYMGDYVIYQHNNIQPINCCKINKASWLTMRDMDLFMKYKTVRVYEVDFTIQEINLFLKKWMECSMMKNVELTAKKIDIELALEGLPVTQPYKHISGGWQLELKKCYEIQRKDGVRANIWKGVGVNQNANLTITLFLFYTVLLFLNKFLYQF